MGKKIFKYLGITAGVLFLLFLIMLVVIFYHLPSAKEINHFFKKGNQRMVQPEVSQKNPTLTPVQGSNPPPVDTTAPAPNPVENKKVSKGLSGVQMQKFMDETAPMSEFCQKLNHAKAGPLKVLAAKTDQELEQFNDEDFDDPRLEALSPLAKTILQKPAMQKLVLMIMQTEGMDENQKKALEEEGLFSKAHFYAQAFQAFAELKSNIKEYEAVVDRTYLFYKLNDLVAFKPDLQNDQRVQKFCEDTEYLFNAHKPVEFENEKRSFERLIGELGVEPQQIKYNPDYKTTLSVNYTKNSLQMGGGWLNELAPQEKNKTTN